MRVPYSERERGPKPRTQERIDERTWGGLVILINTLVDDGSFGAGYPAMCQDGRGPYGCDRDTLGIALRAEVEIEWPLRIEIFPDDQMSIFDMLEFLYEKVGKPIQQDHHSFFGHYHLTFDVQRGQAEYVSAVNRLFARNGIAFEMTEAGQVRRVLSDYVAQIVTSFLSQTGDFETDRLLSAAHAAVTSRSLDTRRDGLEKLWDAFERMKTLEPGKDKKASAEAMLNRVTCGPVFRALLGAEAKALTDAGNTLRIRHSELSQEILSASDHVDYLYARMLVFVHLLLRARRN